MSYGKGDLTSNGEFDDISTVTQQMHERNSQADYTRLIHVVPTNIEKIKNNTNKIKSLVELLGTNQDNAELRERLHKQQPFTKQLSKDTSRQIKDLQSLCHTDSASETRQRKAQVDRLKKDFGEVLNTFQAVQRDVATAEKETVARKRAASAISDETGSLLPDTQGNMRYQEQATMTQQELQEIQEQEIAIRKLEKDIMAVNEIFKDLGQMVEEQGETIDRIEDNITTAAVDVEKGKQELVEAQQHQTSARKKKLICAAIIVVLLIIIIVVIVVSVQ